MVITQSNNNQLVAQNTAIMLDPKQRPDELKSLISSSFEAISKKEISRENWRIDGDTKYQLCGVKEQALMKAIIREADKDQKDFYILDIGAGDFQWIQSMAKFLNAQKDLPRDIRIHIIGVRGEKNSTETPFEEGLCQIYSLGSFKIEDLTDQLKERNLELSGKIDLAVSRFSFRHLADPVGTFVQTYDLLRPKTGHLLIDGFFFLNEEQNMEEAWNIEGFRNIHTHFFNKQLTQLFISTLAPFVAQPYQGSVPSHSLNRFLLRKPNTSPCRLPMCYSGTVEAKDYDVFSHRVTQFRREEQPDEDQWFQVPDPIGAPYGDEPLFGDKALYEWLKTHDVLENPCLPWKPLKRLDEEQKIPLLHHAIVSCDLQTIEEGLKSGIYSINDSDDAGNTALHYSILKEDFKLFELLLNYGANYELFNNQGFAPMHIAAACDKDGKFLQRLIDRGARFDFISEYYAKSAIEHANEAKNSVAMEILKKAYVDSRIYYNYSF